jgi:hypothetical protein
MGWVDHRLVFRCDSCHIRFLAPEPIEHQDRVFALRLSAAASMAQARQG